MESTGLVKPTVLVVDDTPDNLALMSDLLRGTYKVKVANSGEKALDVVHGGTPPDLILLDIMMPGLDGYEVCERLKANPDSADIPVIFLTAKSQIEDERRGLELGAVDYLTKPVSPPILMARVRNHLTLKAHADFLRDSNEFLENEVARRTQEVTAIQDVTTFALASLAETRDSDTGSHIRRTQHYVRILAIALRENGRYARRLTDEYVSTLFKSAPLHDIGKVGIPDRVLLKPGKLDDAEYDIMKTHAVLGYRAIVNAERELGADVEFLAMAKDIALSHHEKWNGAGYPNGLEGDDIPLSARLMAVADVYDALISRRIYKDAMPHEKAAGIMTSERGSHFDPDVVDAFERAQDELIEIAVTYADSDAALEEKAAFLEQFKRAGT